MRTAKTIITSALLGISFLFFVFGAFFTLDMGESWDELTGDVGKSVAEFREVIDNVEDDEWEAFEEYEVGKEDFEVFLNEAQKVVDFLEKPRFSVSGMIYCYGVLGRLVKWQENLSDISVEMFGILDEETLDLFGKITVGLWVFVAIGVLFVALSVLLVILEKRGATVPYLLFSILMSGLVMVLVILVKIAFAEDGGGYKIGPGIGIIMMPILSIAATVEYEILGSKVRAIQALEEQQKKKEKKK